MIADLGGKVTDILPERVSEAVLVLARAFEQDPLMRHLFREPVMVDDERVREFYRFSCVIRLHMGWPLIGVVQVGGLVSVAGLTEPGNASWPDSLAQAYERLKSCMGAEPSARLEEFSHVMETNRPEEPHIYLGFMDTDPKAQGKGYGRVLFDWIHRLSEAHPTSIGVALDTENPANVQIYEHLGYRTVAEHALEDLRVWCMFRPNGAGLPS